MDVEKLETKSGKATYGGITGYIKEKHGFKVSTGYIAQVKDKAGIKERTNYNIGSGEGKIPICPKEKEDAILDAFRHFNII